MKKFGTWVVSLFAAAAVMMMFSACSTSQTNEGEINPEDIPAADAATDAIPATPPDAAAADPAAIPPPSPEDSTKVAEVTTPPAADPVPAAPVAPAAPEPVPAAPAAPVAAASSGGGGETTDYHVQAGDTLMKIAFETYADLYRWKDIYEANKGAISDPNNLSAGTVLKLEKPSSPVVIERNGEQYLIKRGDTLGTISDDVYGTRTKWKKLFENNRQLIKDPNKIFAGFYLYYVPEDGVKPRVKERPVAESAPPAGGSEEAMAPPPAPSVGTQADGFAAPPVPAAPAAPGTPEGDSARVPAGT